MLLLVQVLQPCVCCFSVPPPSVHLTFLSPLKFQVGFRVSLSILHTHKHTTADILGGGNVHYIHSSDCIELKLLQYHLPIHKYGIGPSIYLGVL